MSAVEQYQARVDAVLEQRTRLRGTPPPGDLFDGLPPDHPLMKSDPRRPLDPTLAAIASLIEPDDTIVDVGGGAGRFSLPLALRCRKVVNVEPSGGMLAGFAANAQAAGIANIQSVQGDWLTVEPPRGTVALVNHVAYLTRDIVTFIRKLEVAASRRVIISVASPPNPSRNRPVFHVAYEEPSEAVPGYVELINVLWELGIEPNITMLPDLPGALPVAPTREAAIDLAVGQLRGHQWAFWPLAPALERTARERIAARLDDLFRQTPDGFVPTWTVPASEVLITWQPC